MTARAQTLAGLIAGVLWLASCGGLPTDEALTLAPGSPTSPPPTPSPTPRPRAALVDGTEILLEAYEEELARYEAAQESLGIDLATLGNYREQVLQALIDRRLLAGAARDQGLEFSESELQAEVNRLASERGGNEAMGVWLAENSYTLESFMVALEEELLAAEMVDRIASGVSQSALQVHARHILVRSRGEAEQLREDLLGGAEFAELAVANSLDLSTRLAGGDLGWFPEGYLIVPEVEAAAFALQPGELSPVVQSPLGFHLVEVIEVENRELSPGALRALRQNAVEDWLAEQRAAVEIEIFLQP